VRLVVFGFLIAPCVAVAQAGKGFVFERVNEVEFVV